MATETAKSKTKRVFRFELKEFDVELDNETFYIKSIGANGFSFNLKTRVFFWLYNPLPLALQLASYLGAKNIYLLVSG